MTDRERNIRAFEQYAREYDYELEKDEDGEYIHCETAEAFDQFMFDRR